MTGQKKVKQWHRGASVVMLALAMLALLGLAAAGTRAETVSATGTNAIANGDFESGGANWICRNCSLNTAPDADSGSTAATLVTTSTRSRGQVFQKNISLQPNATYEFSFWAKSSTGSNLQVILQQQVSPFTNYGIANQTFDLTPDWQQFTITFVTKGFSAPVNDARLRIRLDRGKGKQYVMDNIVLQTNDNPPPPPPPGGDGDEKLIFDWNGPVTQTQSGFIMDKTSSLLSENWVSPVNYGEGTLYFRARVRSIPVNQPDMKLGWCFWQGTAENCKGYQVPGVPGTDLTWSYRMDELWKKGGLAIDWSAPRKKMGFIIRDGDNDPVSLKTSTNWGGNDPLHWYPMDIRYQVVLVAPGGTFSGWQNYP